MRWLTQRYAADWIEQLTPRRTRLTTSDSIVVTAVITWTHVQRQLDQLTLECMTLTSMQRMCHTLRGHVTMVTMVADSKFATAPSAWAT